MVNHSASLNGASAYRARRRIDGLMPHEHVSKDRLERQVESMQESGVLARPIVVFHDVILDGHTRTKAAIELDCEFIEVTRIDFFFHKIFRIGSWNDDEEHRKITLLRRALARDLYPPKSTRCEVRLGEEWKPLHHHEILEPKINIKLKELRRASRKHPVPIRLS